MSLLIGIHAGTLRGAGSATVGRNVLEALSRDSPHRFFAWVPDAWERLELGPRWVVGTLPRGTRYKLAFECITLPRALARQHADRLFSMGDTSTPFARVPHLLLVQQAFLAYHPDQWGFAAPARLRMKMELMAAYFRRALPRVTLLTVQTEDMKTHLADRFAISPERIVVIPSSVSHRSFPEPAAQSSERIVYVAGASPHKNHEVLAALLARLSARHPNLRCSVTLRRGSVPGLESDAATLGVLDRFDFLGNVLANEIPALLASAAVVVIPSKLESFGLTYYEAMSAGRPIVAADRPFAREACGECALYAPPNDPEALAAAVDRLLESRALRDRLVQLGRERVRSLPTWKEVGRRYLSLLEAL